MLSYVQMEKYFSLLQIIDQFKTRINQNKYGVHAQRLDGVPGSGFHEPDRIGAMLADVEKMTAKLQLLEEKRDRMRPEVEETIKTVAAGCGKNRIRIELILTMRYLSGRDLEEIGAILQKKPVDLKAAIRKQFDKFGEAGNE